MKYRLWVITGAAVLALALALAVRSLAASGLARAGDYDLFGMLREMHRTNTATQEVNDRILDALKNVQEQAARVASVDAKLGGLEAGLIAQQEALNRLTQVTADHARLSLALQELTAAAVDNTRGIAATAKAEAQDLATMNQATAALARKMNEIRRVNLEIADKLDEANTLSADILDDMP